MVVIVTVKKRYIQSSMYIPFSHFSVFITVFNSQKEFTIILRSRLKDFDSFLHFPSLFSIIESEIVIKKFAFKFTLYVSMTLSIKNQVLITFFTNLIQLKGFQILQLFRSIFRYNTRKFYIDIYILIWKHPNLTSNSFKVAYKNNCFIPRGKKLRAEWSVVKGLKGAT